MGYKFGGKKFAFSDKQKVICMLKQSQIIHFSNNQEPL